MTTAFTPRAWRFWSGSPGNCPTTSGWWPRRPSSRAPAGALTLSDPIRLRRLDQRRFAVLGTPTDCVLLAVQELIEGGAPDLVLSGVNRGQNIAEDVSLSGTVAAAIEGMALGIPSIALSQSMMYFHDEIKLSYETAEVFAPGVIARLLEVGCPRAC